MKDKDVRSMQHVLFPWFWCFVSEIHFNSR